MPELSWDERNILLRGKDLVSLTPFLPEELLEGWACSGILIPINYDENEYLHEAEVDFLEETYRLGDVVSCLRHEGINGMALDKAVKYLLEISQDQESELCVQEENNIIAELEEQLATALQQNEDLEKTLADARISSNYVKIEGHGLCSIVIRMRQEGKTDEDIAKFLDASGCSNAQIGVLLHPNPEASQDARTKLAQRLLGKA